MQLCTNNAIVGSRSLLSWRSSTKWGSPEHVLRRHCWSCLMSYRVTRFGYLLLRLALKEEQFCHWLLHYTHWSSDLMLAFRISSNFPCIVVRSLYFHILRWMEVISRCRCLLWAGFLPELEGSGFNIANDEIQSKLNHE